MMIKFRKASEKAVTPLYSREGDAAVDLIAISATYDDNFIEYDTGIQLEIPEGFVGIITPRSSISNKSFGLANSVGIIDSNYRGSIKVRFRYPNGNSNDEYNIGDRVAQLIVMPIPKLYFVEFPTLSSTNRGEAGFGSSGN